MNKKDNEEKPICLREFEPSIMKLNPLAPCFNQFRVLQDLRFGGWSVLSSQSTVFMKDNALTLKTCL